MEKNKPNNDNHLNDFNPYNNLKNWSFNKSESSNEKQDNNKQDAFNDENHGEFDSINIESFENEDNSQNTQFTLYNKPQNKNYLGSLKNFNHGTEEANKKVTIAKNSFIQTFNAPKFDSNLFNVTDIIYGTNVEKENLSFIYVKLRILEELRDILRKFYNDKSNELKDVLNKHHQINNELNEIFKKHQASRDKVITEMANLHNPLYNFYNNPPMDNYKLYTSSQKKYVNDLISALRKVESQIEKTTSSMSNTYINLTKNKANELKDIRKKYTDDVMNYNNKILGLIKNRSFLNDDKTIPFIEFLINTLKSKNKLPSIQNKLKFLLNQFRDAREKYSWHKNICEIVHIFMVKFIKDGYSYSNNQYFNDLKLIASKRAILIYNDNRLKSLEELYKYLKEVLFHIFKMLGRILIDNPDPQNNLIFKDEIYEFDTSTPKSKFTSLKNEFLEIFKVNWESYNNKDIEGGGSINNDMILISNNMNKFKNLIDSMECSQKNDLEEKNNILDEIQKKLDKKTYDERKEGFKSSLELAKTWEKKKAEILTKLNKENDETVQLEEQIKKLFKKCSDMIAEKKYMKELTLEINEKIKGISDKKEYIKKAIDLDKEIKENVGYIDKLAKESPYEINKYIEKKDTICNTIKSELNQIYVGDINQLYNELSSIINENVIDNAGDKTKLEALKSKINDEYNKIENMKIQMDASHLNIVEDNKNALLNTISETKKYIYDKMNNDLNKMLNDFKNKETNLLSNINDYSKHSEELNNYKTAISEIRNIYNDKINICNIQEDETRKIYEKSKECIATLSANENEVLKNINEIKNMKDKYLEKVNIYINFDNIYKENVDSEHNKFTELTDKIKVEVSDEELKKYEKRFNDSKSLINETKKSIEEEYQNINILKKANEHIKECENTTELIKKIRNKHNELSGILNKNIGDQIKELDEANSKIENIENGNKFKSYLDDIKANKNFDNISKSINNIKNSTYEIRSDQIARYANIIQNLAGQAKEIQNNLNKDEIDDIIQKIINYNKEIEIKLHTIVDNKNRAISIISHIKNTTNLTESEYNAAIKYEGDANSIILDLNNSQNILNHLINQNLNIINDLRNRRQHIQSRSNLYTINREQEITQTKHFSNTKPHDVNDTKNINKNRQHSSSNGKGSSKERNTENTVRFAGAIAIGLVVCYAVTKFKEKNDKDQMKFDKSISFYHDNENENVFFERKEEVIEVTKNDDL